MNTPILKVEHLTKVFYSSGARFKKDRPCIKAVDDVSFSVMNGETFGIVGESGCGKSTLGKTILRLHEPTGGRAELNGQDIFNATSRQMKELRKKMQIVFQDPYASLDPHMTVKNIIQEPLDIARDLTLAQRNERVLELMDAVGLHRQYLDRFPYEFSGGQRQRICIARALAVDPQLLICDEPVSALDVSVQSQILNLFQKLQNQFGLTYLFISHDLSVVQHVSDRICVMYLGQVMEIGSTDDVYKTPQHPYTQCLLSAVLQPTPHSSRAGGAIPRYRSDPERLTRHSGCPFYARCPHAQPLCMQERPQMTEVNHNHYVACHLFSK